MTASCWTLSRRKIRQNKRYSAKKPAGRKTCRFFVILCPTFLVGPEHCPTNYPVIARSEATWQSPDITSAPSAPAFKRGLSAEQADWGSSVECHFSPPGPSGHPPRKRGGARERIPTGRTALGMVCSIKKAPPIGGAYIVTVLLLSGAAGGAPCAHR